MDQGSLVQDASVTPPPTSAAEPQRAKTGPLKFNGSDRFLRELRRRVDAYFQQTGRSQRGGTRMYFKTATILAWLASAYILLLFVATSWWAVVPLAIVLGLSVAGVGFNIQHDGGHKGYSTRPWLNKLMAMTLDLIGGSSYMWNWKHNTIHHTYPNVSGEDDDINIGVLGRLAPQQPRYAFHRFQGIYLWGLYGFLTVKWHLFDDFWNLFTARISSHRIPRPKGADLATFIGGKVAFFSLAFIIPMLLHPWWAVLTVYAIAAFVCGVVLSVVFQLAHCVEEADFPVAVTSADGQNRLQTEWAVHQVQTTVNFARGNRLLGWYVGGLNFQIEHHLFHKISHIHYPAISKVIEATCKEYGVRYVSHPSFFSALASHYRWLRHMGRPVTPS